MPEPAYFYTMFQRKAHFLFQLKFNFKTNLSFLSAIKNFLHMANVTV